MKIDLKQLFNSENAELNSKMYATLLKAIRENAQADFDYLKFKQSVESMKNLDMDTETSIKSAYATASVMGLTKKNLLKSAEKYKIVLDKEKEEFAKALKNQIANNIDGKRVEAQRLVKEIELNKQKIQKLQEQIGLYQEKIDSVEDIVQEAKNKIESTRDRFKTTFDDLYRQIDDDIINFDKYL